MAYFYKQILLISNVHFLVFVFGRVFSVKRFRGLGARISVHSRYVFEMQRTENKHICMGPGIEALVCSKGIGIVSY